MKKKSIILLLVLFPILNLFAHPHVFVKPKLHFIITKKVLKEIKVKWIFDSMTTNLVLETFDRNKNKRLDKKETAIIKKRVFPGLAQFHYYTYIIIDGRSIIIRPKNFKSYIKNRKLVYSFKIKVNKKIKKQIKTWSQDKSIYVSFDFNKKFYQFNQKVNKKVVTKHGIDQLVISL